MTITPISTFEATHGGTGTFSFRGDVGGDEPLLLVTMPDGYQLVLNPADLGEFAAHAETARKALLKLWMER